MNYSELVAAVQSTTENTFNTVDMNRFIAQAEKRIYVAAQFPILRKNVLGTTAIGNQYVSSPSDFLAAYSLAIINPSTGAYTFLLNKDVNYIREAYPTPTVTGVPKHYAIFGPTTTAPPNPVPTAELTFILGPTPDAVYNVEMHYFYYPESIVTAGNTWLSDNFDPVLLYGALVEANIFMKGEADIQAMYESKFQDALVLAKRLGDGMERRDAYRSGQARAAVN